MRSRRALKRGTFLKVPHHGSPNGDSLIIWSDLLERDASLCLLHFAEDVRGVGHVQRYSQTVFADTLVVYDQCTGRL